METFAQASRVEPQGEGRYEVTIDEGWYQGPGAFGGIVAAWLLRAMEAELGDPTRRPRALTVQFCAPAKAGETFVRVRRLRAGLKVSYLSAELLRHERVVAAASATFARPREAPGDAFVELARPAAPPAEAVAPWAPAVPLPVYATHFLHRRCLGGEMFSGHPEASIGGWIRSATPEPVDAPLAAALLDAWPPAVFARLEAPRPAGTVHFTAHFLADLPAADLDPAAFLLVEARSRVSRDGYSEEDAALWTPDGRLLASARQLVALI